MVVRYLRSRGYDVTFVQNITDIEDKIINKANEEGVSWQEIVDRYTDSFHERLELLGIGLPDVEPRATEHIPEMISLIEELIEKGHAYAPGNGDVYYSVESFPGYGSLSHQRPKEMRETEKGQTEVQEEPAGLRALEGFQARRALLAEPLGTGPSRLAHRVLGDGREAPAGRRGHPRRRHGHPLPAPRERARPERARPTRTTPSSAPGRTTGW